ncbi:MAG: peptidylprolyl isomerase [Pirellulaceae bacterium]
MTTPPFLYQQFKNLPRSWSERMPSRFIPCAVRNVAFALNEAIQHISDHATSLKRIATQGMILGGLLSAILLGGAAVQGQQAATSQQSAQSEVVAVVNGSSLSRKMLGEEALRRYGEDVLESMVNKYLILQACKQKGINITNEDVEQEVQRIAAKFGLSVDRYLLMLQQERKIAPTEYRRDIVWPMLALQTLVAKDIEVTQQEFNQAFQSQYGESVKCRMIMIGSQQTAQQLHGQAVKAPAQFGQLAKDHSEDEASASVRGMIPPIHRHTSDPIFEKTAFALKPNEISQPFQVADQWIILQCVKHLPAQNIPPQQVAAIRQQLTDRIRDQKMRVSGTDLFQQLQQQAQVVNVLANPELRAQYPGAAALINGQQLTLAQVIAECIKRHGVDVLEGEINRTLLEQELKRLNVQITSADIQLEVARAAESYGFVKADGKPDTEKWLAKVTSEQGASEELYVRDAVWPSVALKKMVEDSISISDEDLRKGFESNFGERVEVLAIVLSDQKSAQQVWDLARDNPTDEFFGQLAEQYSIEPVSQSNLGRVPPIRRHGGQPAVEDEAFRLKPGELSGIVATGDRFIIMRCQGRTSPIVTTMDPQVRQQLIVDLTEKKTRIAMAEKFDQLKNNSQIDNYLAGTTQDGRLAATAPVSKR